MKFSKKIALLVCFAFIAATLVFPSAGYAWQLAGNSSMAAAGPAQAWNWKTKGVRVGGYTYGQNTGAKSMQIRIQAYRLSGNVISFSQYKVVNPGATGSTAVQLGCTAPWTFGNHPFRAWISPYGGTMWTGGASAIRTQ